MFSYFENLYLYEVFLIFEHVHSNVVLDFCMLVKKLCLNIMYVQNLDLNFYMFVENQDLNMVLYLNEVMGFDMPVENLFLNVVLVYVQNLDLNVHVVLYFYMFVEYMD